MPGQATVTVNVDIDKRIKDLGFRFGLTNRNGHPYSKTQNGRSPSRNAYMTEWIRTHPEYRAKAVKYSRENYITINGKKTRVANKRLRPEVCELCGRNSCKLDYHHWNNSDFSKGLWLCYLCHMFAEYVDKEAVGKYLEIKERVRTGLL